MDKYKKIDEMAKEMKEFAKKNGFAICLAVMDENDADKNMEVKYGSLINVISLLYLLAKTTFDEAPDEVKGNLKKELMELVEFICDTEA